MNRRTALSQKELTGYAKAMQLAGITVWNVQVTKPDGTVIRLSAGVETRKTVSSEIEEINRALGIE